jgi:hypothetical protein
MHWRLFHYALLCSALSLTACAKADDSGVDSTAHSGDLCDQICTKAASVGCKSCSEFVLSACEDTLTGACAPEQEAWIRCVVGDAQIQCSDTNGFSACNTEADAITACSDAKIDTCSSAKNGKCEEPSPCLTGTDTTDCTGPQ